jgi:general secretion pathway protein D
MKVKPEVSAVESTIETSTGNVVPIVATQQAETHVMVRDGITIVMGGLIEEFDLEDNRRVPFIGDIPVLGFPFRKKSTRTKKNELVLFLTPRIIAGDRNFFENPDYEVSDTMREMSDFKIPDWYVDPISKTRRYLKDEFLSE